MMKKIYSKPSMKVIQLQHRSQLLQDSRTATSVRGNVFNDDAITSDEYYSGDIR